jgi:thiamine biosynthesis lipoprotein
MGTYVEVISNERDAEKIVFGEIRRLENLLSKFKPDSEISRLNKLGSLKVSPDTLKVIKSSLEFYKNSHGAFDISVAPLVDIWKQAIKTKNLPKEKTIESVKKLVGSDKIMIDEKRSIVKFLKKGMQIDLGGIAKGYAVNYAVKKLKSAGIKSCLVNAGGNMFAMGKNGNRPWKIGIRHPRKPDKMINYVFLTNKAIATSGDYEQYFEVNNRRFSHIIDPKTGYPADTNVVSVTVISSDATTCDALGTAVFVLGKTKGKELIQKYANTDAIIITKEDLRQ